MRPLHRPFVARTGQAASAVASWAFVVPAWAFVASPAVA